MHHSNFKPLLVSRLMLCLLTLVFASPNAVAQQAPQANQSSALTLPTREGLARPLLLHAESAAATFDPATRSLVLYRAAGAGCRSIVLTLYGSIVSSFAAAGESAPAIRHYLEEAILNDLLPLSPTDVLDLLPGAAPETRMRLYGALLNFSLFQADYGMAVGVFEQATSAGVLPLRSTDHLFASLPDNASSERASIFTGAIHYYEGHPNPEPWRWTLADLVGRFYKQLPGDRVLQAIHIALTQAEQQAGGVISMGPQEHLTFHSDYDFQLFAVAPALQQLDPVLAPRTARRSRS
jgi:hypothetical protein